MTQKGEKHRERGRVHREKGRHSCSETESETLETRGDSVPSPACQNCFVYCKHKSDTMLLEAVSNSHRV